jgi:hypothetical protein
MLPSVFEQIVLLLFFASLATMRWTREPSVKSFFRWLNTVAAAVEAVIILFGHLLHFF